MEIGKLLALHGQEHLLDFDGLTPSEKSAYLAQLGEIDWETVDLWKRAGVPAPRGSIAPIEGMRLPEIEARREAFEKLGIQAIREGKVAAVLLAGGQGTRLGADIPKGTYDIGVTRPLYIFEQLIANLREVTDRCGAYVPLLIMTSEKNDAATQEFFRLHGYFGYPASHIVFFRQQMAPCVGFDGKILLEDRGKLALSPNGNGGWYASMKRARADERFPAVEWYNVFAVDNVLQRISDPVFIGATIASGKKCGAKVVCKDLPQEKVGVLCLEDGAPAVIEYYELTEEMAMRRDAHGDLQYSYGVILNYLFEAARLREIASAKIPVHVVKKKIPCYQNGRRIKPETENGYKFETLILDMVKLAGSCLPFEVEREREFAPIKNLTGVDSVESARALLARNGVKL